MDENILYVDNLIVDKVINGISFSLNEKTINAVLCPNNCGKTTLIKTLSGVIYKNSGKIVVNDIELSKSNFDKYILEIGTVLEDIDNSFIKETVIDELKYPLINLGYKKAKIKKLVDKISDITEINSILDNDISDLDTVNKIKTLIATSIIHEPKVLFIDDVLRFLSKKEKKEILDLIKRINYELGITILYTTSDIEDIIDIDNIIVMSEGKIKFIDTYKNIIYRDNDLTKMGFTIPVMIDLSRKLEFYNLLDDIYYDPDKVVNKLWN